MNIQYFNNVSLFDHFFFVFGMLEIDSEYNCHKNDKIFDLHTADKIYVSNMNTPEIELVQFSNQLLTNEQLDELNIWEVFVHINTSVEIYKKIKYISMAIQFMNTYDIMESKDSPNHEEISNICKDLTVLIAPQLPPDFLHLVLDFFITFAQYEDNNSLMPFMCYEIFRHIAFREKLFQLIDDEIQKREDPSYYQTLIDNSENTTIIFLVAKLFSSYFKKAGLFEKLNVDFHSYVSFVEKQMCCKALLNKEKLELLKSVRRLTPKFRKNPDIDVFLDIIKENIKRIADIEGVDISILKFIKSLVFKRDEALLNHIFFETKLSDGNPIINFVQYYLSNDENQMTQIYAIRILFKILAMNPSFFNKLEIDLTPAFNFIASENPEISTQMLSELLNLVTMSREATQYLCENQLLDCLHDIFETRNVDGKLKIFSILRKITIDYKTCISPEYIIENVIPMSVDILRLGKNRQIQSVFSILQNLFRFDEKNGMIYDFKQVFAENDGIDALQELLEDSSDDNEKSRIQGFLNNFKDM